MANKIQKPCRVCGKMFTPCADCENDKTMFRWRRFVCSISCAKVYFAKILDSRQNDKDKNLQNKTSDNNGETKEKNVTKHLKKKNDKIQNKENESEQIE